MLNKLFILSVLSACGVRHSVPMPTVVGDDALTAIVGQFEKASGKDVRFSVVLEELGDHIAGICLIEPKQIILNSTMWAKYNYYWKEQLVWHELGHCVLGLHHDDTMKNGMPVSIMYPRTFGHQQYYVDNRAYYMQELLERGDK